METKRFEYPTSESESFINLVLQSKNGNKESLTKILNLFKEQINYLSKFIMLPKEECNQALTTELISIILDKL